MLRALTELSSMPCVLDGTPAPWPIITPHALSGWNLPPWGMTPSPMTLAQRLSADSSGKYRDEAPPPGRHLQSAALPTGQKGHCVPMVYRRRVTMSASANDADVGPEGMHTCVAQAVGLTIRRK